jgi:hypothetical protein
MYSFVESDDRVAIVLKYIEEAVKELDEMDALVQSYKIHLNVSGAFAKLLYPDLCCSPFRKISRTSKDKIRVFRFKRRIRRLCSRSWRTFWCVASDRRN